MARPEKVRLGEILVQQKLLSEEQLEFALSEQKRTGRKLGRVFVENGLMTEEQISGALAQPAQHSLHQPEVFQRRSGYGAPAAGNPGAPLSRHRAGGARRRLADRHGRSDRPLRLRRDRAPGQAQHRRWRWSTRASCCRPSTASTGAPRKSPISRASWSRTWAMPPSISAPWAARRGWKRRRSSSCCSRCSTTPARCAPPTSTSSRRKSGCRSASASTACCTCRPRPTSRSRRRWRCA